jgi:hypothetical protein
MNTPTLPPLTQELIQAAKNFPDEPSDGPKMRLLRDYCFAAWKSGYLRDCCGLRVPLMDAAINILTRAIEKRTPIPNNRTKVGDWVRVCYPAEGVGRSMPAMGEPWLVLKVCPFRGVRIAVGWARSWVRVKGGAE